MPLRAIDLDEQEYDDLVWSFEQARAKSITLARNCGVETAQKHAARARRITSLAQKFEYHQRDVREAKE